MSTTSSSREYNHTVAQLLLTGEDIRSEQRSRNVRNTLSRLLELGALPVINENDAVATDEIGVENTIGENDTLSAIVAAAIGADLLVLLSDIDGLYDSDPHKNPDAKIIPVVGTVDASTSTPSPGARAPRSGRAAWSRSSTPRSSRRRRAARWSSPTAASPNCSMTSRTASPSAPDF